MQKLEELKWSVDTPALLNDIIPNAMPKETIYPPILNIFTSLLAEVARRATELHDPKMDILMLRLNLYEIEGKDSSAKNKERMRLIEMLQRQLDKEKG